MSPTERYKGQDRIIEAIPEICKAGHDVVYVIAGGGDDRSRLERLADRAGVIDRVRFEGMLTRDELIEAYRMADLFVMPSTGEGFGIAFLEAMACGTRALGINAAGARDALVDGELGIIGDENKLAQSISQALSQPRPDPGTLHERVQSCFGRQAFQNRIATILNHFLQPA
jgi:phosphatidylinositol alpha-1,6-mannosyltransferase